VSELSQIHRDYTKNAISQIFGYNLLYSIF